MVCAKNMKIYLNLLQLCMVNHRLFFPDKVYMVELESRATRKETARCPSVSV